MESDSEMQEVRLRESSRPPYSPRHTRLIENLVSAYITSGLTWRRRRPTPTLSCFPSSSSSPISFLSATSSLSPKCYPAHITLIGFIQASHPPHSPHPPRCSHNINGRTMVRSVVDQMMSSSSFVTAGDTRSRNQSRIAEDFIGYIISLCKNNPFTPFDLRNSLGQRTPSSLRSVTISVTPPVRNE
ncbi:hypothetical protein BDQ17DRAFT_190208 [Cyathus striatus]|nr:hypothetical protein BDQ17DRAFT_190208 [Cyathus striatus]